MLICGVSSLLKLTHLMLSKLIFVNIILFTRVCGGGGVVVGGGGCVDGVEFWAWLGCSW